MLIEGGRGLQGRKRPKVNMFYIQLMKKRSGNLLEKERRLDKGPRPPIGQIHNRFWPNAHTVTATI